MKLKLGDKVEILLNNSYGKEEVVGVIEIDENHLRCFDKYTEEVEISDTDIIEICNINDTNSEKYIVYETLKAGETKNKSPIICIQKLTLILSINVDEMNNNFKKTDSLTYKRLNKIL